MQVLRALTALQDSSPQPVRLADDQLMGMLVCSLAMLAALNPIQPPRRRSDPPQPVSAQVHCSRWAWGRHVLILIVPFCLLAPFWSNQTAALTLCRVGAWLEPSGQSCMQAATLATVRELCSSGNSGHTHCYSSILAWNVSAQQSETFQAS